MHVGTDFLKLPPVTGQYWSLFQCSMLGTGGTCEAPVCAPRAPIRFTMTGMAIPNLHGNTVGNSEMTVKHTNVLLRRV